MKLFNLRMLITSSCLLMVTNPIEASTIYSTVECQQIASAILNGQRPPLTNDELADLDSETAQRLTDCLKKLRQAKEQPSHQEVGSNQREAPHHDNSNQSGNISQAATSDQTAENDEQENSKSEVVSKENLTVDQQKFIDQIAKDARQIADQNDLYTSVLIAQTVIESDWGRSELAHVHHNLFGIKGTFRGMSTTLPTKENINGQELQINAAFRRYSTFKESLNDYAQVLNQPLYFLAHKSKCHHYKQATEAIGRVYATDPMYHQKLNQLIEKYDLTKYDQLIKQAPKQNTSKMELDEYENPQKASQKIRTKHHKKGIVLPIIGGIGSMSLLELVKRLLK